jgi:hypothetical protein
MDSKQWYLSKTFWFNLIALVVLVVSSFGYADFIPDKNIAEYAAALVTLINIILRFVTNQGLKIK